MHAALCLLVLYAFAGVVTATLFGISIALHWSDPDVDPDEPRPPAWLVLAMAAFVALFWVAIFLPAPARRK